jgi:hypothetical protein
MGQIRRTWIGWAPLLATAALFAVPVRAEEPVREPTADELADQLQEATEQMEAAAARLTQQLRKADQVLEERALERAKPRALTR